MRIAAQIQQESGRVYGVYNVTGLGPVDDGTCREVHELLREAGKTDRKPVIPCVLRKIILRFKRQLTSPGRCE